jgi:hypothetical protein
MLGPGSERVVTKTDRSKFHLPRAKGEMP